MSFMFSKEKSFVDQIESCEKAFHVERLVLQRSDFTTTELATALHALGQKKSANKPVIARLVKLCANRNFELSPPRELANCLRGIAAGQMLEEIPLALTQQVLQADISKFTATDIANTLWAYTKLGQDVPEVAQKFRLGLQENRHLLRQFTPQELTNVMQTFALQLPTNKPDKLEERFSVEIARRDLKDFNSVDIPTLLWSFAALGHRQLRIYSLLSKSLLERKEWPLFTAQALANLCWALTKAQYRQPLVFDAVADDIVDFRGIQAFTPQGMSMLAWSFAKQGYDSPKLFVMIAEEMQRGRNFTAEIIANTLWAFAKLDKRDEHLFQLFADEIQSRLPRVELKPKELSSICYSFAACKFGDESLFCYLAGEITRSNIKFMPKETCNVLWSFASLGFTDEAVFKALTPETLDDYSGRSLSILAWSFASQNLENVELFTKIHSTLAANNGAKMREITPKHLSNLVWAFATMHHEDAAELFNQVVAVEVLRRAKDTKAMSEFNAEELSSMVWSFAEMGVNNGEMFDAVAEEILLRSSKRGSLSRFSTSALADIADSFVRCGFLNLNLGERLRRELVLREWSDIPPAQVCKFLSSLSAMGIGQIKLWECARALDLKRFSTREKVEIMRAFAAVQQQPQVELLSMVEEETLPLRGVQHIAQFTGALRAMAKLDCKPSVEWLDHMCAELNALPHGTNMPGVQFNDLAPTCAALKQFRCSKANSWLVEEMSRLFVGEQGQEAVHTKRLAQAMTAMPMQLAGGAVERELVARDALQYSDADMATVLSSLAHAKQHSPLFSHIERHLIANPQRLAEFTPRHLTMLLWAFATQPKTSTNVSGNVGGRRNAKLFECTSEHIINDRTLDKFDARGLVTLVWTMSQTRNFNPVVFQRVAEELSTKYKDMSTKDLHDLFYSFTHTRHADFVERLANELVSRHEQDWLTNEQICFLFKGLTQHKLDHSMAFAKLVELAEPRLPTFDIKLLRKMVWAFANSRTECPDFFSTVVREIETRKLDDFTPRDMGLIVRALALAKLPANDICAAFAHDIIGNRNLSAFHDNDLTFLLARFATVGYKPDDEFCAAVERELVRRTLDGFPVEHINLILSSFCAMNYRAPKLFAVASAELQTREMSEFTSRELRQIMLHFASQNNKDSRLFEFCSRRIARLDAHAESQQATTM